MRNWSTLKKLVWLRGAVISAASYIWAIVTGAAPLVLPGAVAKPLKSLIQYGVCEENDGDVYCNNGKLVAVDDELPSGYKRIVDISFDGNIYYDTGRKMYGTDVVTMTVTPSGSAGQNLFGAYSGTGEAAVNFSLYAYGTSTSKCYFRYGQVLLRPTLGSGERTISFGAGGTSGFMTDTETETQEFTTTDNAYIGALPNSTSAKFSGTITGEITVGERLKYVPCERESDNAIGYYELVNGEFLEPQGSGTPTTSGYDSTHLNTVTIVGTPEVLTIGEQTASVDDLFSSSTYADEQDIIAGTVTRKVEVTASNGTITISPLAAPTTETVEAQVLRTEAGDNTISATAEVAGITLKAEYAKGV